MWPGVKGRPSYAAYEQPPFTARRSACGLITVTGTRKMAPSSAFVVSVPSTSAKWAPGGSVAQPTLRSKPFPPYVRASDGAHESQGADVVRATGMSIVSFSLFGSSSWSSGLIDTAHVTSPFVCCGSRR